MADRKEEKKKAKADVAAEDAAVEPEDQLTEAEAAQLHDVYDWLRDAPKLRDAFLFAVCGPVSKTFDDEQKREALAAYTRGDVVEAYDAGFC